MTDRKLLSEFESLVNGLCEGTLSPDKTARLEQLALADTDLRRHYIEAVSLHATLGWNQPKSVSPSAGLTRHSRSPIVGSFRSLSLLPRRSVLWSFAGAALAFCVYFAFISWNLRPDKLSKDRAEFDASVATIRSSTDLVWSNDHAAARAAADIRSGESLKIASGSIELELKRGTKLVLEGPADFSVDSNNRVSLRAGSLLARVPKQAIGFTVVTPKAEIVDLGTEFGVEVDKAQNVEVHVVSGVVVARRPQLSAVPDKEVRITAGNAWRVSHQAEATSIPFNAKWRVPLAKRSTKRQSIALQNSTATFSQPNYSVSNTIDGQPETGWAMMGGLGSTQQAVWETTADVGGPNGTSFVFTLAHTINIQHGVGKFRLSVTTDDRSTFADGLPSGGNVTADWTELKPLVVFSDGGETFTINEDNTILVSGTNPASTTYSVAARTPLSGITGIRLEVFADDSFTAGGPGRYPPTGNFGLSEFRVQATLLTAPKPTRDQRNPFDK